MLSLLHTQDPVLQGRLEAEARAVEKLLFDAYPIPSDEIAIQLLRETPRLEDLFLTMAFSARGFANHYRRPNPYQVGVVVVGLKDAPAEQNPWSVAFSANTKPHKNHPKQCAEWWLMEGALQDEGHEKLRRIIAFYVVGEPRTDDVSVARGVNQVTLTPCKICRDRMWALSRHAPNVLGRPWRTLISAATIIVTADYRNLGIRKRQNAEDLHPFHKEPYAFFPPVIDE